MRPDNKRHKADEDDRKDHGLISADWFTGIVGDNFSNDTHRRQDENINFRMSQEPEQMLPKKRVAPSAHIQRLSADHKSAGQEKTGPGQAVHKLHDRSGFQG